VAGTTGGVLLLIEDDDSIGQLVKRYLEQQDGWRVLWLRSGEEAIAKSAGGCGLIRTCRS
jgi:DNA-binding response OmpR family regulator